MAEPVNLHLNSDSASDRQRQGTSTPSLSEDGGLSSVSSTSMGDEEARVPTEVVVAVGEEEESESEEDEDEAEEEEEEEGPPIPQPAYL
jgi:hypothetical protein